MVAEALSMDSNSIEYDLCMFNSVAECEEFIARYNLHLEELDVELGYPFKFTNKDGTLALYTACNPLESDGYMSYATLCLSGDDDDLIAAFYEDFTKRTESCK